MFQYISVLINLYSKCHLNVVPFFRLKMAKKFIKQKFQNNELKFAFGMENGLNASEFHELKELNKFLKSGMDSFQSQSKC